MDYIAGTKLLRARYQLFRGPIASDDASQSWIVIDEDSRELIAKLWPFQGAEPDVYQRALWDSELRTLYRLGSSPDAEDTLIFIRDAGVDREARAFVMVLEGNGYDTLAESLHNRAGTPWLTTRESSVRSELWHGLLSLVDGLMLLHEQRVLHRNIRPETVFLDARQGPSTFRLGGFEWSLRLGVPAGKEPPRGWSSPPEFFENSAAAYRPETDWFAIGILIARCMLNVEAHRTKPPIERHIALLGEIHNARAKDLGDLEKHLVRQLILQDPTERLTKGHTIRQTIIDIINGLGTGGSHHDERPLILAIDPNNASVLEQALAQGFLPDPGRPYDAFNPRDPIQVARLTEFIRQDLRRSQIYPSSPSLYILNGGVFTFRIAQFEQIDRLTNQRKRTWDIAFCIGLADLRVPEVGIAITDLADEPILVRTVAQIHRDRPS